MVDGSSTPKEVRLERGVRLIAVFEALKGFLVLLAGFGLLSLVGRDVQAAAEWLVRHMHLNPARHYPRIFLEAAAHTSNLRLRQFAALAFLYAVVRIVEAYGLWHVRPWAEWFAIVAGSVYVPVEVYEIFRHPTWMRAAVLISNLAIVAYLAFVRRDSARHRAAR